MREIKVVPYNIQTIIDNLINKKCLTWVSDKGLQTDFDEDDYACKSYVCYKLKNF